MLRYPHVIFIFMLLTGKCIYLYVIFIIMLFLSLYVINW